MRAPEQVAAVVLAILAFAAPTNALETIFLVRHGEKASPWQEQVEDFRPLSAQGRLRAETLARHLADAGIEAVYTSPTARTVQTGMPLALALGLELQTEPATLERQSLPAFFAGLEHEHPGSRAVLVVGHSNTIPDLLKALGADPTCFERLGLVPHPKYGHLIEGYEGIWEIALPSRGCDGMSRHSLALPADPSTATSGAPGSQVAKPSATAEPPARAPDHMPLDSSRLLPFDATYRILYGGQSMGLARHQLRQDNDVWTLSQTTEIPRAEIRRTTELLLQGPALTPSRLTITGVLGPSVGEADLSWAPDSDTTSTQPTHWRIRGHSNFPRSRHHPQGSLRIDRQIPAGTFEKSSLPMLLAAMPLEPGAHFSLVRYAVDDDQLETMEASVGAVEEVTVPAGTFTAFRVTLQGDGEPVTAWVRSTPPNRLLELAVGSQKWQWVLVEESLLETTIHKEKAMPQKIDKPTRVEAAGNIPKLIDEFVGRVNTGDSDVSIAVMQSPEGWEEPGQRPEFDEFTLVLEGLMHVEHEAGTIEVGAGQAVIARAGEWIRYSTPGGARYVAVCLPAFSPDTVHRDD